MTLAGQEIFGVLVAVDEWIPEAVALARDELGKRGISADDSSRRADGEAERARQQQQRQAIRDQPMGGWARAGCFLDTLLLPCIIIAYASAHGRERAVVDGLKWWGYGWAAKFGLAGIAILT